MDVGTVPSAATLGCVVTTQVLGFTGISPPTVPLQSDHCIATLDMLAQSPMTRERFDYGSWDDFKAARDLASILAILAHRRTWRQKPHSSDIVEPITEVVKSLRYSRGYQYGAGATADEPAEVAL